MRYADDFVILARYVGDRITGFVEQTLQGRFDLTINAAKTRTVKLNEPGASLDFLGYTFRYDRSLLGRPIRYLNLCPSAKSLQRERDQLRSMTGPEQGFIPIPELIEQINRHLKGWSNYYRLGYPRKAFRHINRYVQERLERHLKRRSQRPYRVRGAGSWYAQLKQLGLQSICGVRPGKREPKDIVRAGCGKSARPVRRGRTERPSCRSVLYSTARTHLFFLCVFAPLREPAI